MEHFHSIDLLLFYVSRFIAIIGVIVILLGCVKAAISLFSSLFRRKPIDISYMRLEVGYSIILGLEFMVGADIIESMVQPGYYEIGILACLVLIRTFLSYFLNIELQELKSKKPLNID